MTAVDGPVAWAAVAAAGAAVGWVVTTLVGPLVAVDGAGRPMRRPAGSDRRLQIAAMAGALALWWWEAVARGQVPEAVGTGVAGGPDVLRYVGHLALFGFLAAAAWVDLRHKVIPDAITMPGTLAGLAWSTLVPAALLPIAVEVPRSFAQPLLESDVLGLVGGLRTPLPSWLESWPGLAVAIAVFVGWWLGCTGPLSEPAQAGGPSAWLREPRNLALLAGMPGIVAAWSVGGPAWRGLLTALAGLFVAAGMIWLTRAGASRALGREAMGLGDVTLMATVGAWLGWQPCILVCGLAVFIGLAHGVVQVIRHRESELPFGPSLCLGTALVVVAWRPLWARSAAAFERPLEMAAVVVSVIVLTAASLLAWRSVRPMPGE